MRVIAIDGPGGAGKSTVSRVLAERLGLPRLDTGAMYRAVALAALRDGVDPADAVALTAIAEAMDLVPGDQILLDGADVSDDIRTATVDAVVPLVAAQPGVRSELVRRQRAWATSRPGCVVEGRDIGTVVFPDAVLKIYLTASSEERARRRAAERGDGSRSLDETRRGIETRDALDSGRETAPLAVADGAIVIDSTARTVDDVVDEILAMAAPA